LKKVLAIIFKDTRLRFSGPSEWLFFLILPILFTVILAGGTGGSSDSRVRLVVVDQASSPLSAELVATLGKSEAVRPELLPLSQAEDQFSKRTASAVLIIPPEFDLQHLQQGNLSLELRQLPNNMNALVSARAVQAIISRISSRVDIAASSVAAAERIRPFESAAARQAYFDASLKEAQVQMNAAPQRVSSTQAATKSQIEYDPRANSSAGQLITWVFIPLLGISGMFAYERQKGTLRRLLTTPTQRATYLSGTILGQVATGLVQMSLLVVFGILVMKLNWGEAPVALALILVTSALAAAALGTTLGTFTKTEGQAGGLSWMLGMVMALLGGCWYPIELFPPFVQNFAKILPTTWAMQGMLDIVMRGQGLLTVLPNALVLLGFAVVFFVVGVLRFRYE
jgi:ABC-2 type transport system permease protein